MKRKHTESSIRGLAVLMTLAFALLFPGLECFSAERTPEQGTITWQKTYESNAAMQVREAFGNAHSLLLEPGATRTYGYTSDLVGGATVYVRLSGTMEYRVGQETPSGVIVAATMTIDQTQGEAGYLGQDVREGRLIAADFVYQSSGAAIISSMAYVDSATEEISSRPREAFMDSLPITFPPMPVDIRSAPVCTPFRWIGIVRNGKEHMLFASDPREGGALITGNGSIDFTADNRNPSISRSLLIRGVVRVGEVEEIILEDGIPKARLATELTLLSYSE